MAVEKGRGGVLEKVLEIYIVEKGQETTAASPRETQFDSPFSRVGFLFLLNTVVKEAAEFKTFY